MQKFSHFYVTYRNIVQFDRNLWNLDYFEKSALELMADSVVHEVVVMCYHQLSSTCLYIHPHSGVHRQIG